MKKLISLLISVKLFAFIIGVGGFQTCINKNGASFYKNCPFVKQKPLFLELKKEAPNVNAVSMWITRDWQKNWYPADKINLMIKKGYVPIFIFYWFGDDISPNFVKENKQHYFFDLKRFAKFLKKIKGKKIVILNPEYNENGMAGSKSFDLLQAKSILILKEIKNTIVGICPGDFGNYNVLWDEINWKFYLPSMKYSGMLSDFIAFQEMRALTRNTKDQILNTPLRALAFATFLHKHFNKPTFLAYLAVSSYKDEKLQAKVFQEFAKLMPLFKHTANLIGFNLFNYIDVPTHKGYFKEAEKFFGIKRENGEKKKSFKYFIKIK
ncbi:hypothetical protein [Caminibacter sp.]